MLFKPIIFSRSYICKLLTTQSPGFNHSSSSTSLSRASSLTGCIMYMAVSYALQPLRLRECTNWPACRLQALQSIHRCRGGSRHSARRPYHVADSDIRLGDFICSQYLTFISSLEGGSKVHRQIGWGSHGRIFSLIRHCIDGLRDFNLIL